MWLRQQSQKENVMRSGKEVRFQTLVFLALAVLVATVMAGQNVAVVPSGESSRTLVKQQLEQLLLHVKQTHSAPGAQASPARFDPRSRDEVAKPFSLQTGPVRLPGAPMAAARYVFGRMDLATGDSPTAVAAGAFQTGGPTSIAVANTYYSDTVSIYLANSDGSFQPRADYATGVEPSSIFVADLNGDHNLDLAVSNWSGTVSILLGNGDGTFQPHVDYSVGGGFVAQVVAGDFNHDNKLDLAVAVGSSYSVSVLLGNGDGTFRPSVSYPAGNGAAGLVAGDFNGDNQLDLAVAGPSDQVAILLGNGDGTFKPPVQYATGAVPLAVVTADFNGDHKLDLAVINATSNNVSILLGNGDGTFQSHVDYAAGDGPYGFVVADLNGDGKLDLAITSFYDNSVSVLLGKGNGTFETRKSYGAGLNPWGLATADLNGDGKSDLVAVNYGSNTVTLLVNEGKGTFQGHSDAGLGAGAIPFSLAIADLGADHIPDLLVGDFGSNSASILLGKGAGKFRPVVSYPAGFGVLQVSAGDFNGDTVPDLVATNAGSNAVSLLLGKSDGTFGAPASFPTGGYPIGIATGDFNGDGKLDLASANEADSTVSVLLGNGNGEFSTHVDYAVAPNPYYMISADVNLDGKLDLVTVNAGDDSVSVLLGKGDGTFLPAVTYPVTPGANPYFAAAGDFNHDGKLDLAVTDFYTNTISILIGNGDGTFQPHVDYPTGLFPEGVVVGDFNADGVLDLAVSNSECSVPGANCPGTFSILFGNGDGTFQQHVDYPVGIYPIGIASGDLNGDGGSDLAVANAYSNSVSLLLNLPVIGVFPGALNFGAEKVGIKSIPETITIGNPSGTPITISKPKITGANAADFAETMTCPLAPSTLVAGSSCSISVTFTPKSTGSRTATLSLKDSVPGSPQLIPLGGTGQ
jgi:hypothetical protein